MPRVALVRLCLLSAALLSLAAPPAAGQLGTPSADSDDSPRVHPPTDRLLSRGLRQAEASLGRGEFAQALTFLDELLGRSEDVFAETGAEGGFAGLKETCRRLIRDLPLEGRRAYEATYAPVAERLLRQALVDGDPKKLELLVQRYFYTPAGYQAALLRATDEADAGRHLAAGLIYQQLLETPAAVRLLDPELSVRAAASWLAAGEPDHAREILDALGSRGRSTIEIAGEPRALDAGAPLDWLKSTVGDPRGANATPERQWLTYRGNAARNGTTAGGLPHIRVRWRARLLGPPKLEQLYEEYLATSAQSGQVATIAAAPLAAGDTVVVRSPLGLLGVNFRTGNRIWEGERQLDKDVLQLIKSGGSAEEELANAEPARSFTRRIADDFLYGVTSSDGARVYAIRDLPLPSAKDYEMSPFMSVGADATSPTNRLSAYDLSREGLLVWEVDGVAAAGELNGAYFLGAPLAVGTSLYALIEIRDDIYLAALDQATGALQWRQQLASLETGVLLDLRRRLQAAMPSYDSGILVCPTGAGLVVGVDLAKQSLAWAYQYRTTPPFDGVYRGAVQDPEDANRGHWVDGAVTIADGRVLITPRESDELHCLDLRTGALQWKQARGDMTRLACVDGNLVLMMHPRHLRALRLADGRPAWPEESLELPRGASPSGSGFLTEGRYIFPLTNAEVVAVDVAAGKIVASVTSRDGEPLGNLICHRGAVISHNGASLDCFDQVDMLLERSEERLAENENDVDALRALGEIAYNEGRLSEAIELVERAYRQSPDDLDVREILAECLADTLQADFAAYQSRLPLLKELGAGNPAMRANMLRIESQGLLAVGDLEGSAAACLAMARSVDDPSAPLKLRREHEVVAARWVQGQLAAIWEVASADQRTKLTERIRAEFADPNDDAADEDVARFLQFFGSLPAFDELRLVRARQLEAEGRTLESQQLLLDLERSADVAVRGEAVARLAAQLHAADLHVAAREYDDELAGPLADQPCLDGATGREVVARWAEAAAATRIDWPGGAVDALGATSGAAPANIRARAPMWNVQLEHTDAVLGGGVGYLTVRGAQVSWHDGLGRGMFAAAFDDPSQAIYRQAGGAAHGSSRGNLLLVSLGRELAAFNTFAGRGRETPALVWRANLANNLDLQDMYFNQPRRSESRPGSYRPRRMPFENRWLGVIGPVTSSGCIFQDQRRLVCVDPTTGEPLWWRSDVPPGCDLFGDDRYVLATPAGARMAKVFSAIDGRAFGEVRVPEWDEQLTTRGRRVVRWSTTSDGELELSEVDPLEKSVVWTHAFAPGSRVDIDRDRFVAVVEPQGRTVLIDLQSGAVIADHPRLFSSQPRLEQIHLRVGADHFTLVVEHPRQPNSTRTVRPLSAGEPPVVDGELIVLDRRTGASRWQRPASLDRQALVLNAAPDLPFVLFAGLLDAQARGEGRVTTTILMIDKATGRTIYRTDELPQTGVGVVLANVADAARHEVNVELVGRSLLVQYTDRRRPPQPPAMAEVESPAGRPSGGILEILGLGE